MATVIIMPKQGQSVETCIITKWFRSKGDKVSAGDILFSYETDKAAFDFESPAEGYLLDVFFGEGAEVPVLENVAVLGNKDENGESFRPGSAAPAVTVKEEKKAAPVQAAVTTEKITSGHSGDGRIRISPRARRMAGDKGLDISAIHGSGPNGRIVAADISNAADQDKAPAAPRSGAEHSDRPLSNLRRVVAKAMHASLQNSAQLTHHMSADARNILGARKRVKKNIAEGKKQADITLNDMICMSVINALKKFPEANSHFMGDFIRTFNVINLGIAVDTPRGLMVPAVRNAGTMSIEKLSDELKSVAAACRKGNVNPELIQSTSASFTISNLGNYGVEMFTPVINLPQVAVLGVCTIIHRPADMGNHTFGFVPYLGLSLTYDHRAIDGGPATLFLKEIKEQIEKFNM